MYLNKVMIVGNLTRDPELKTLPSGMKVTSFSLATNRVWMKDGQKQEAVDYHNIVVFGRQAETSAQYLKKGSQALIEGRLQTRSWDDAGTGKKMYRTEIVADRVQFGRRSDGSSSAPSSEDSSQTPDDGFDGVDTIDYPEEDINPEDIPF
ncbi:single-stranded DNA-binding protein [Patescibacteria group bacterium]|nr:single-stranded DNA-binding protein [Patescibacteria group bacterium]